MRRLAEGTAAERSRFTHTQHHVRPHAPHEKGLHPCGALCVNTDSICHEKTPEAMLWTLYNITDQYSSTMLSS